VAESRPANPGARLVKKTLILLSILFPLALSAQEVRYYDVEVILFENLDPAARQSENWPESVELELDDRTIEIGQPWPGPFPEEYEPKLSFKPLPPAAYQLNEQARKIDESPSRRVLLHTAWRQPGMPQETALKVHFQRHIPAGPDPVTEAETANETDSTTTPASAAGVSPEEGDLEGLIQVMLARYLHVRADIVFRPKLPAQTFPEALPAGFQPLPATSSDAMLSSAMPLSASETGESGDTEEPLEIEQRPVVYRLEQIRRRMRSRELHYLDHPVIGMLIRITPYES